MTTTTTTTTTYYHGSQETLVPGSLVETGHPPKRYNLNQDGLVFFSDNTEFACFWGCEGGVDQGGYEECHVYEVQPTGHIEPDRGVATGQVQEGNFQSRHPLMVLREVLAS